MAEDKDGKEEKRPIIVKRIRRDRGVPSTSWKPAPSYFAAMMIPLFLLAWLLATASPEARKAIGSYFDPQSSASFSGGETQR